MFAKASIDFLGKSPQITEVYESPCWTHRIFVILQKQAAMTKMEAMLNQMDIWEEIAMINVWKPQNKYSPKHLKALTVTDGARCLQGLRTRFRNHTFHSGKPLIIGIYHVASTRRHGDMFSCVLHTIYLYICIYIYMYMSIQCRRHSEKWPNISRKMSIKYKNTAFHSNTTRPHESNFTTPNHKSAPVLRSYVYETWQC